MGDLIIRHAVDVLQPKRQAQFGRQLGQRRIQLMEIRVLARLNNRLFLEVVFLRLAAAKNSYGAQWEKITPGRFKRSSIRRWSRMAARR